LLQIAARGLDPASVEASVAAAIVAVEQVQKRMSFHDPASELSELNRQASRRPVEVHPWIYAVLRRAKMISAASDGLFDVTVAPALMKAGVLPRLFDMPAATGGDWRDLELLPDNRVCFAKPLLLDLGGIAKGYAVDLAFHALRRGGCTQGSVNAGGDLRVCAAQPQLIHLRTRNALAPAAELRAGAVAPRAPTATKPTPSVASSIPERTSHGVAQAASWLPRAVA
jgi:FAD:protein FMN transferase